MGEAGCSSLNNQWRSIGAACTVQEEAALQLGVRVTKLELDGKSSRNGKSHRGRCVLSEWMDYPFFEAFDQNFKLLAENTTET